MYTFIYQIISEGLGQLEAYVDAEEGVAFQMDNGQFWNSLGRENNFTIYGATEKTERCKFLVTYLPSGKVVLKDWTEAYLAVMPIVVDTNTYWFSLQYALVPVPFIYPQSAAFKFEVFHTENKIAFRAFNGLFLSRVERGINTIEASKQVPDSSCCFQPMIGDLDVPNFEILGLTTYDCSTIKYDHYDIKSKSFVNNSNRQKSHTFIFRWYEKVMDRVLWKYRWGLGVESTLYLQIDGMRITLKYSKDNEKLVYMKRVICERHIKKVVVPPKSTCTAYFVTNKCAIASFTFTAAILKKKSNGDTVRLHQQGVWVGLVYRDTNVRTEIVVHA